MTGSPLARSAGPIAITAAALVVLTRIVQILNLPADLAAVKAYVVEPLHAVASVASIVAFAFLVLALFALHDRQARAAGTFGAVAVGAAVIGTVFMAGDWWYEAFAVPWMADGIAPLAFESGPTGRLLTGGLASFALFGIGWMLFAIASLRAGQFPAAISVTVLVGAIASGLPVGPAYLVGGIILGVGIGWLGFWSMRTRVDAPVAEAALPA